MMTPEVRLERLEQIAKLLLKAGLRQRRESHEQADKIDQLINHQAIYEQRFTDQNGRIDNLIKLQKDNEVRFARLAECQINTERRFQALIEIVHEARNGRSRTKR
jgi:hypothetical protein